MCLLHEIVVIWGMEIESTCWSFDFCVFSLYKAVVFQGDLVGYS